MQQLVLALSRQDMIAAAIRVVGDHTIFTVPSHELEAKVSLVTGLQATA